MAEESLMWGGITVGDAVLAPYDDDEFSDFLAELLQGDRATQGVVNTNRTGFTGKLAPTNPAGTTLRIANGLAFVDGKLYRNDANIDFALAGAGYYRIVVQKVWATQIVRVVSLGPQVGVAPAVTQTDGVTWEISLCTVYSNGAALSSLSDTRRSVFPLYIGPLNERVASIGGDARGNRAVDMQAGIPSVSTMVASGVESTIGGGLDNTASQDWATVGGGYNNEANGLAATISGGIDNIASGPSAVVMGGSDNEASGWRASAVGKGVNSYIDGGFAVGYQHAVLGDCQYMIISAHAEENHNDTTWREILARGGSPLVMDVDTVWTFDILISGLTSGAAERWGYRIEGCAVNDGGTITVLAFTTTAIYETDAAYDAQVVADNVNDALSIQVRNNGGAAYTVGWTAVARVAVRLY